MTATAGGIKGGLGVMPCPLLGHRGGTCVCVCVPPGVTQRHLGVPPRTTKSPQERGDGPSPRWWHFGRLWDGVTPFVVPSWATVLSPVMSPRATPPHPLKWPCPLPVPQPGGTPCSSSCSLGTTPRDLWGPPVTFGGNPMTLEALPGLPLHCTQGWPLLPRARFWGENGDFFFFLTPFLLLLDKKNNKKCPNVS